MKLAWVLVCAASLATLGCSGRSDHYEDRDWTKDHGIQTGAWREVETLFSQDESDVDRYKQTPRGVRLDLTAREVIDPDTRCHCIDVVIGRPGEKKKFSWAGKRPKVSQKHMAFAIRQKGSKCSVPQGTPMRPSIRAVDVRGRDVIVVIEELPYDRPQALGAIIKKPHPEGHLWVRSARYRNRVLPYARGVLKNDRCLIKTDKREHHLWLGTGRRF